MKVLWLKDRAVICGQQYPWRTTLEKTKNTGFLVATQKLFGQKETFLYVCIVKHQYKGDENDRFRLQVKAGNGNADARHCMNVKGCGILIHYSSELSEDHSRIIREDIRLNGKKVDVKKGRVYSCLIWKQGLLRSSN